jgi:hypothetical protein
MNGLIPDYRAALNLAIQEEIRASGEGGASCWEDYRHRAGIIRGLKRAKDILAETIQKYNDGEDED